MSKKYPDKPVSSVVLNRFGLVGYAFVCLTLLSAAVLFLAGCEDAVNTTTDNFDTVEFNTVDDLKSYLTSIRENTETTPYRIKLDGIDLSSGDTLKKLYEALNRYVTLDLSGCTGEKIPGITGKSAKNKEHIVSVILPKTVTVIESRAFTGCTVLKSIEMPGVQTIEDGNTTTTGAFSKCTALTNLSIPNATTIGSYAFYDCSSLSSISMPETISIGSNAFNSCDSLTDIRLPQVRDIGYRAFWGCAKNKKISVTLGDTPPTLGEGNFAHTKTTIYVPTAAVETYQNTDKENWEDTLKAKIKPLP